MSDYFLVPTLCSDLCIIKVHTYVQVCIYNLTGSPGLPLSPGTPCIPSGPCVHMQTIVIA